MNILWRITKLAALERSRRAGAWVSLIIATILFLSIPRLIGVSIDHAISGDNSQRLLIYLGFVIIGVVALRGVFNYANLYLAESVSQHVSYRIRNMLYDKLQHLSFYFFLKKLLAF